MTDTPFVRQTLDAPPAAILSRLIGAGRIQIGLRSLGALHERLGPLEAVNEAGGLIRCTGEVHDSSLEAGRVATVVLDQVKGMTEQMLPKIDFLDAAGASVMQVVGLNGSDVLTPLADLPRKAAPDPVASEAPDPRPVEPDDIGGDPFRAAAASGETISIVLEKAGVVSSWQGVLKDVRVSDSFINLIHADFHLHLRGGAVADWKRTEADGEVELRPVDPQGVDFGLSLRGPAAAFGA